MQVSFVRADVSDVDDVTALVKHVTDAHGRLDCAANCAGSAAATVSPPITRRTAGTGSSRSISAARSSSCATSSTAMTSLGLGGAIVNVASTLGLRGSTHASAYSASKHAVLGITRTAAIEYAPQRYPRQRRLPGCDRHADDGRGVRPPPRLS